MIAARHEPPGLAPDTPPLGDFVRVAADNQNAITGSRKLRDALLCAQRMPIPQDAPEIEEKMVKAIPVRAPLPTAIAAPRSPIVEIQAAVAHYYGISPIHMTSDRRDFSVSHPRQVAMYLASELTGFSLTVIGKRFNRDHTTVLHAIRAVKQRAAQKPMVWRDVQTLLEALA